jgi:hypothetical protein
VAKLIVQTPYDTYDVPLRSDVTIGRSRSNTLRIDGPQVSRNHAVIFCRDSVWQVRDLDSRNGLYVNGVAISYSKLGDNDEVTIGEFRLRFVSDSGPAGLRLRSLSSMADYEEQSESTTGPISGPESSFPLRAGSALVSAAAVVPTPGNPSEAPVTGGTQVSMAAAPLPDQVSGSSSQPQEIFFRLADVERMIDRWDGTNPNQFLADVLRLHQRIMNPDRLAPPDLGMLARHLLSSLAHAVGATRGVILRREASGLLTPMASEPPLGKLTVSRIVADVALRRLCTLCTDCQADERFRYSRSIHNHGVVSLLCVPLVHGHEVVGMIYLDTNRALRSMRREHLHLAAFIGRLVQLFEGLQGAVAGHPLDAVKREEALGHDGSDALVDRQMTGSAPTAPDGDLSGADDIESAILEQPEGPGAEKQPDHN